MAASARTRYDDDEQRPMIIHKDAITGLVLAGGRGTRMGGVDKGLQTHLGIPLAQYALERLRPQVAALMLNANRNIAAYQAMGAAVWPDEIEEYPGPLAGMLAGLKHCTTPYLVTVPCDTPNFPLDLVARLSESLSLGDDMATAYTLESDGPRAQPVFCLMKAELRDNLEAFIRSGERKTGLFAAQHRSTRVIFRDPAAFANANTLDELAELQINPRP
jgi:molybdopterin-guanine dinucleotide biosynthesis protein A